MLMAHPVLLTDLLERYEALRVLHAEDGSVEARQRLEDVSYTLCIATGTRDIDSALTAARRQLAGASGSRPSSGVSGARPDDDALMAGA
ncbi:DUF5133 domain-containing protein [Streptomyces sp. NRRL B-3229]|uniref:DUF5133 domain-containing protein n=1 Tax=Streptomyces sp. NRRL B-3229 TaxID=1463836 RepID=UPI0004BF7879|nr:DUF5133 domain-containing protein [Streptomyces sp. NRRL B-3229]